MFNELIREDTDGHPHLGSSLNGQIVDSEV